MSQRSVPPKSFLLSVCLTDLFLRFLDAVKHFFYNLVTVILAQPAARAKKSVDWPAILFLNIANQTTKYGARINNKHEFHFATASAAFKNKQKQKSRPSQTRVSPVERVIYLF